MASNQQVGKILSQTRNKCLWKLGRRWRFDLRSLAHCMPVLSTAQQELTDLSCWEYYVFSYSITVMCHSNRRWPTTPPGKSGDITFFDFKFGDVPRGGANFLSDIPSLARGVVGHGRFESHIMTSNHKVGKILSQTRNQCLWKLGMRGRFDLRSLAHCLPVLSTALHELTELSCWEYYV